jgi:hypothetical protein
MRIIAILLIVLGGLALAYQGFTFVNREPVARIGNAEVTAPVERTVWIPPVVGGAAVIAGAVMLGLASKKD